MLTEKKRLWIAPDYHSYSRINVQKDDSKDIGNSPSIKPARISAIDGIRGFALVSIIIIHHINHFGLNYLPENFPDWMKALDIAFSKSLNFLISGKAYSIFALLFGLTFYIMFSNQQNKSLDFRPRFLLRLFVLFVFGLLNSIFYHGDILTIYAVLGVLLIIVCKLNNKIVFSIALLLIIQPLNWSKCIYILNNPEYVEPEKLSNHYFAHLTPYLLKDSFFSFVKGNIYYGRLASIIWSQEGGRLIQSCSLFLFGMLMGRLGLFFSYQNQKKFWTQALFGSISAFAALFILKYLLISLTQQTALQEELGLIFFLWLNLAFTAIMLAFIVIFYQKRPFNFILLKFESLGRMSLSVYIMQSILGSFIYYGYGLGLYKYTGATYSLLIAAALIILQIVFCRWWLKSHKQGPLEAIWHRLTWVRQNSDSH